MFAFSTGKARSFTRARRRRRAQAIAGELAKAIKELGHDVPYGIYYLAVNTGWVSVGIDNDAKSGVSAESLAPSILIESLQKGIDKSVPAWFA